MTAAKQRWYLYLLQCQRGTYVGITNDLAKRYRAHCEGKGARYTRANPPQALLGAQPFADRAAASRAEYALKQKRPEQKRHWAAEWRCPDFSDCEVIKDGHADVSQR
ncbi:MAG: GIY-YIG nuclease family protein [Pseudomonadota bacterium]